MATPRAVTPHSERLPPLDALSRTPTSLSSSSNLPRVVTFAESPKYLAIHPAHSPNVPLPAGLSPSLKPGFSPRITPIPLTGQAAMAEAKRRKQQKAPEESRQTSPNPAVEAMHTLMGGGGMSKASDAPAPDKLSEPMRRAAEKISIPESRGVEEPLQPSPVSMTSFASTENAGNSSAMTATANNTSTSNFVAEPAQMSEGGSYVSNNRHLAVAAEDGSKAFSYPGPPLSQSEQDQEDGPSRGMSLPGYGQGSPKSPASNKRHKCPYCATDFTRHHNLKSHLLTHSQEKPYVCQTCQARFRRLHDLKRHTKLHTGERPHICEKCGRKFARGDALARHNKGSGGCAGRRSSFGGEDDYDEDGVRGEGMDGVVYTGDEEEEAEPDDHGRRVSEPSRKRAHLESSHDPNREVYRQHSSTYPPVQGRPHGSSVSSMGPPQVIHPGSGAVASPRDLSGQPSPAGGSSMNSSYYGQSNQVFGQQNMIESPKPLSPGQPPDQHRLSVGDASMSSLRNRSPSLTTQFQQQHFGRGGGGRTPPQPPTHHSHGHQTSHGPLQVLPPLHAAPPPNRGVILPPSSVPGPGPSMLHHQQLPPHTAHVPGQGSNQGSLSSHERSSGSSIRDIVGHEQSDIWGYVRSLEQRFSRMQDEYELRISRLQEEVISLKGHVSTTGSYSSDMVGHRY